MFIEQIRRFGPFRPGFLDTLNDERLDCCLTVVDYLHENKNWLPFAMSSDKELAPPDRDFIAKIMALNPRDRPTARELLQDAWFQTSGLVLNASIP